MLSAASQHNKSHTSVDKKESGVLSERERGEEGAARCAFFGGESRRNTDTEKV